MAYNEQLADRVRDELDAQKVDFHELKMMEDFVLWSMIKCVLVWLASSSWRALILTSITMPWKKEGASEMNFTGKAMKGFVFVNPEGTDMDNDLAYWVELCVEYNPFAKSSKK